MLHLPHDFVHRVVIADYEKWIVWDSRDLQLHNVHNKFYANPLIYSKLRGENTNMSREGMIIS
jgi:hypothetical protein